jgi:hypothetical protein
MHALPGEVSTEEVQREHDRDRVHDHGDIDGSPPDPGWNWIVGRHAGFLFRVIERFESAVYPELIRSL